MTSTNPASATNSVAQTISTSPTSQPTPSQHTAIAAPEQQQTHPVPMTPPKSPASASPRATRVPGSTTTAPEESRAAGAELTQPLVELEDGEIARDASSHGEASDSDTDVEILMHSVGRMGLPGPGEDGGGAFRCQLSLPELYALATHEDCTTPFPPRLLSRTEVI